MRIIPKKERRTINLWTDLYQKLHKIKEIGKCMSDAVGKCLNEESSLNDILEKEGIKMPINPFGGTKIVSLLFSRETLSKIDLIKKIIPSFSSSVTTNLCLIFRSLTVDSILQNITGMKKEDQEKNEEIYGGEPGDPIPEHILKHIREIRKNNLY